MRLTSVLLTCTLLAASTTVLAGERSPTRYLEVINRAHDSLTGVAVKPSEGGQDFRAWPLKTPVQGGGDSFTLAMREPGCRFDFQLQFRDGRAVVYKDVDVCRLQSLRIDPLQRGERALRLAAD
jgi:hypothetical protein